MIKWMLVVGRGGGGVGRFRLWIGGIKNPLKANSEKCIVKKTTSWPRTKMVSHVAVSNGFGLPDAGGGKGCFQGVSVKKHVAAVKSISHCRSCAPRGNAC